MTSFVDSNNRTWVIQIHVAAVKRLRALVNVDLYALLEDGTSSLGRLLGDPVQLCDVLYVLCKDQADAAGISDEDFGRGMRGDAIERASKAFVEEFCDFFQNPRVREAINRLMDRSREIQNVMLTRAMAELDAIDVEAEASKLIDALTNAPESSESTPARSPSAS